MPKNWCLKLTVGLLLTATLPTAAWAEAGGDEGTVGFETRSQARESYTALNEAVFVLLFNEEAGIGTWGDGDNPRAVTGSDSPSTNALVWAANKTIERIKRLRTERTKQRNSATKETNRNSDPSLPLSTNLRIRAIQLSEERRQAFSLWAGQKGTLTKPTQIYLRGLFPNPQDIVTSPPEQAEESIFGRLLGNAVEAVEEVTDTNITFESGQKTQTTQQPGTAPSSLARVYYWDVKKWHESGPIFRVPAFRGALDALIGRGERSQSDSGVTFESDFLSSRFYDNSQITPDDRAAATSTAGSKTPPVSQGQPNFAANGLAFEPFVDFYTLAESSFWMAGAEFEFGRGPAKELPSSLTIKYDW